MSQNQLVFLIDKIQDLDVVTSGRRSQAALMFQIHMLEQLFEQEIYYLLCRRLDLEFCLSEDEPSLFVPLCQTSFQSGHFFKQKLRDRFPGLDSNC